MVINIVTKDLGQFIKEKHRDRIIIKNIMWILKLQFM